ncbi:MAG TPA: hypothetical protein DD381_03455 [Lentisphaeria bacterium]|nr:MAG: hypothetical protein A2X47_02795 [Lentisphaerae bacterium GWF2_38_69]HBM15389.1 hypothetical protein [Lentisphaeria bacterium]
MPDLDTKIAIQNALKAFSSGSLSDKAISLFTSLGYNTERHNPFDQKDYAFFKESFLEGNTRFNEEKALVKEWKSIDLLFQLTQEELSAQQSLFDTKKVNNTIIETYLFFAIELSKAEYSRTALAQITREINKVFPMPAMILFKHGSHLTLSVINRRLHKRDEQKDVLEKVTLIKDISILNPHRAHIEILFDLSFHELLRIHRFTNFVELHNAWQKTLDTKELNKRFYRELSNWYFWAIRTVSFPNDAENDKDDTVFNSESVIRLLTRLIFIWFIKEKNLVPEMIFGHKKISSIIKGFMQDGSNVYYRAILQNLFFGTLNQKIEDRGFAVEGNLAQNAKNYGVKTLYRYASDFQIPKEEVVKLFKGVPFLNGGLFDCLDNEDSSCKVLYLDGFSRNPKKQANVPDELFFSDERTIDLSEIYDDKKKKNEKVKGLFEIFNSYKFTITENTPIEEEIALDPELLGRVFENLLASYNPETKTTARKQTGSFYTPREIVNYMVDESLIAYFKARLLSELPGYEELADRQLKLFSSSELSNQPKFEMKLDESSWNGKEEELETELRNLLSYSETESKFSQSDKDKLIEAIDNCKILDPACGSGAFPMGILHKLVHVLHKLDPQNKGWEERQIRKASLIDDPTIRDKLIADIETAFSNNELDYGRKLYLIENCIYGVDIQPIATQISKLRFFISLIVDQKTDKNKDNFGIRSLPNLETKFVAANTLIDLPEVGLYNHNVEELAKELKNTRHNIFSAKTAYDKKKLRDEDRKIREQIKSELLSGGWDEKSSTLIAKWDPYNQNASCSWFNPEWMFGIRDGFDIVIGNPPYMIIQTLTEAFPELVPYYKNSYASATGKFDIYCLFIEKGILMLRHDGILNYIVPNKWTVAKFGFGLRKLISEKKSLYKLISFNDYQVFNASTYSSLIWLSKTSHNFASFASLDKDLSDSRELDLWLDNLFNSINTVIDNSKLSDNPWILGNENETNIVKVINKHPHIERFLEGIFQGIVTGDNDIFWLYDCIVSDYYVKGYSKALQQKVEIEKEVIYPFLNGRTIGRYKNNFDSTFLIYPYRTQSNKTVIIPEDDLKLEYPNLYKYFISLKGRLENRGSESMIYPCWYSLWNFRNINKLAAKNKILTPDVCQHGSMWNDIYGNYFHSDTTYSIIVKDSFLHIIPSLYAILNSQLCWFYLQQTSSIQRGGFFRFKTSYLKPFPIPDIIDEFNSKLSKLVNIIEFLTQKEDRNKWVTFIEGFINSLVYALYFPEQVKAANAEVLKHLTNLPEIKEDWSDEKKLKVIEKVYQELSDPNHPVSIAMERQKSVPEIRIIEGLGK